MAGFQVVYPSSDISRPVPLQPNRYVALPWRHMSVTYRQLDCLVNILSRLCQRTEQNSAPFSINEVNRPQYVNVCLFCNGRLQPCDMMPMRKGNCQKLGLKDGDIKKYHCSQQILTIISTGIWNLAPLTFLLLFFYYQTIELKKPRISSVDNLPFLHVIYPTDVFDRGLLVDHMTELSSKCIHFSTDPGWHGKVVSLCTVKSLI